MSLQTCNVRIVIYLIINHIFVDFSCCGSICCIICRHSWTLVHLSCFRIHTLANENDMWLGNVVAFNNTTPFADTFRLHTPGGPSNYTGVSQSLGSSSFVWRGSMSGVDCNYLGKCAMMCNIEYENAQWKDWTKSCQPQL